MNDKNNKLNDLREEDPKLFDELMDARDAYSRYEVYSKIDDRKAWEKFRTRYFAPETSRHANPVLRYLLMAAAVACLLIVGTVVLFHNGSPSGDKGQVALSSRQQRQNQQGQVRRVNASGMHASSGTASIPSAIAPMPMTFFESAGSEAEGSGQVVSNDKVVHLEDGTTVWLNSGATLKYPQHFEAGNRTVYLEGEAYFQVHSEADRPFYVRTASGIVREYGTSFNVDAMTSRTIVTLVEGSISVYANGGAEQNIRPGEQAIMTASSQVAQIHKIDVTNTIAWKTGIYKMDDESLEDVALKLQQRYGCKVVFRSESIRNITFSGILNLNRSLTTILSAISFATDVRIRYMDDEVIFE